MQLFPSRYSFSGGYSCSLLLLLLAPFIISTISAFSPPSTHTRTTTSTTPTQLHALPTPERMFEYKSKPPTFNKQTSLWEPSIETEDSPYGPWGSFLRGGPSPFLVRVLSPNEYDQAVFKYMAQTKCSRAEAQGNMDAFFNNAADWAYQKSEEARGRPKVDYTEVRNVEKAHSIVLHICSPIHLSSSFCQHKHKAETKTSHFGNYLGVICHSIPWKMCIFDCNNRCRVGYYLG